MHMHPSFTDIRSYMSYQFSALRMRALRDSLWATFNRRNSKLAVFPEEAPEKSPNRRFLGLQEIRINEIVGTVSRENDFDHKFRPLRQYLRERWVNAYLTLQSGGWSPILVHKVGDHYYVEDGHHRVSVAHELGMIYIQAKVWEYPSLAKESKKCKPDPCPDRNSVPVYARIAK